MNKEFRNNAGMRLVFNDDGIIWYKSTGGNIFFSYGSIKSVKMNFIGGFEVHGENEQFVFVGQSKEDRKSLKELIPLIEDAKKGKKQAEVRKNVSIDANLSEVDGLLRDSEKVTDFLKNGKYKHDAYIVKESSSTFGHLRKELDHQYAKRELGANGVLMYFTYANERAWEQDSRVILTKNMVYLKNGADGKEFFYLRPNMVNFLARLDNRKIMAQDVKTKQSSVIGSAVAGGVLAGGVGAVVGAAAAASNNANGGKTVVGKAYDSGKRKIRTEGISGIFDAEPTNIYLSTKIADRFPIFSQYRDSDGFRKFVGTEMSARAYDEFLTTLENMLKAYDSN